MTMVETIQAQERPLMKIFSNDYAFSIPDYQRPYSWGLEQVGDLLADIRTAMQDDDGVIPIQDLSPYFLGSVVLIKDPLRPEAQVVDGQQRLTTLTIMLSVLRELAPAPLAIKLQSFVCEEADMLTGAQARFRLSPRTRDRDFFRRHIQAMGGLAGLDAAGDEIPEAQANMRANALFLKEQLAELPQGYRDRLAAFLLQRCFLVVVCASDQEAAYRIFSVMNDRGLDLSATDILKAEIIGALPENEELRKTYTDIWEDCEASLGRSAFEDLFAHIRMIVAKQKAQKTLAVEFKAYVQPQNAPAAFIDRMLVPYADAYETIIREDYRSTTLAESINAYLRYLNRLDNFDWMPPAIWYMARFNRHPETLLPFLVELERLSYGLFILRRNATERIQRYGRLLTSLEGGLDYRDPGSPMQLDPIERSEILGRLNGPLYTETRIRLPVLLRLDSVLADGGVRHDPDVVTVEHVLPQTPPPDSVWLDWFPDPVERAEWVHKLGNLALLSRRKNSQASNFDFDRKKTEYFQRNGTTTFALTTWIVNKQSWTREVLMERQAELVGALARLWRLG